jgi:hypothetical protein
VFAFLLQTNFRHPARKQRTRRRRSKPWHGVGARARVDVGPDPGSTLLAHAIASLQYRRCFPGVCSIYLDHRLILFGSNNPPPIPSAYCRRSSTRIHTPAGVLIFTLVPSPASAWTSCQRTHRRSFERAPLDLVRSDRDWNQAIRRPLVPSVLRIPGDGHRGRGADNVAI